MHIHVGLFACKFGTIRVTKLRGIVRSMLRVFVAIFLICCYDLFDMIINAARLSGSMLALGYCRSFSIVTSTTCVRNL